MTMEKTTNPALMALNFIKFIGDYKEREKGGNLEIWGADEFRSAMKAEGWGEETVFSIVEDLKK